MRKIILNLAISLDGYIAGVDGGFEWIKGDGDSKHNTDNVFDYKAFTDSIDTIVMGSKAYEDCPEEALLEFSDKKILVATTRSLDVTSNVEIISGDICKYVLDLKKDDGKNIWLFGGAGSLDDFIKRNIIDEYIIGIIPIILGKGIKLFKENNPTIELHLDGFSMEDGIAMLRYSKRI